MQTALPELLDIADHFMILGKGCWKALFKFLISFLKFLEGLGNSLAVQWLGLHALTAKGPGSIPGWGMKIPQATRHSQKKKKKKSFDKD